MTPDDIDQVLSIEQSSQPSPWPARLFLDELDREWAHIDVVRILPSQPEPVWLVVAFCNYWMVRDEIHLLNLATRPEWRRRGMATRLMDHLLAFARKHQCRFVTLEVRTSNHPAQVLYRRYGFAEVGVRPKYYADCGEDALVMTLEL